MRSDNLQATSAGRSVQEIRDHLHAVRVELLRRQVEIRRDLRRQKDPLAQDADDRAIQLANDEALQAIERAAGEDIAAVDVALEKLRANTYGTCDTCGRPIEKIRLHSLPQAANCAACADRAG